MVKRLVKGIGEAICWWALGSLFAVFPFGLMTMAGLVLFDSTDGFWFWAGAGVIYGYAIWMSERYDGRL